MNYKQLIEDAVQEKSSVILELSDRTFNLAEVGFREFKTVQLYIDALKQEGFDVECGLDGMPTAFKASYGSGKPVIGYLAEYDALPDLSQKANCAERCPAEEGGPNGHGCGHNLLGAGCFAAALGLKKYLEQNPGKGTVVLFGCPSEEKGNSKVYLARDGFFDCLDVAFSWHPGDNSGVAGFSSLANVSVFFRFKGVTSHAAAAPHLGRSALDAAELMSVGVNYLREHIIPEARVHYAYRDVGGIAPNVVQGSSCVHYFIRAPKSSQVQEILPRVIAVAEGAAKMTGTEMSYELYAGLSDLIPNHVVSDAAQAALEELGMPEFSQEEMEQARSFFQSCDSGEALEKKTAMVKARYGADALDFPVDRAIRPIMWNLPAMPGSTDVGDASYVVPLGFLGMATAVMGTAAHTWQMTAQGKSPIAHKMTLQAGKVLALAGVRFCEEPQLVEQARAELEQATGGKYVCPVPKGNAPRIDD